MNMEKVVRYVKAELQKPVAPVPGKPYQKKPEGYNTFQGWLMQGYRPRNVLGDGEVFLMKAGPEGYTYFSRADVEPLTEDECKQLDNMGVKHGSVMKKTAQMFGKKEERQEKVESYQEEKNADSRWKGLPNMAKFKDKKVYAVNVDTNGTDPERDDVLRLVIVGQNEQGNYGVLFQSLFRPMKNPVYDRVEYERAHISMDMLDSAPPPKYVAPYIKQLLSNADYITTYDAKFNLGFLEKSIGVKVPKEKVLDSKEIFMTHYKGRESYRMGDAVVQYLKEGEKDYLAHQGKRDTEYDAKVMFALWERERMQIDREQREESIAVRKKTPWWKNKEESDGRER